MEIDFKKYKDYCIITNNLYLPKSIVNVPALINSLTYKVGTSTISLATEEEYHVKVPKFFKSKDELLSDYTDLVIDYSFTKKFPFIPFESNIKWRNDKQKEAYLALKDKHSGILNLNTGKGKTVQAIKQIEEEGVPALIIVHNSYLAAQWMDRIKDPNINLQFEGKIGTIGDGKFDWKHPICIAMIQSLVNKKKKGLIPQEFYDHFGIVIIDEGHHLGAKEFSQVGDICWGRRISLTATPERTDGLDCIPKYHIGPIIYSDLSFDLIPDIYFVKCPHSFNFNKYKGLQECITQLTKNIESNNFRISKIKEDYDAGYKVLCISSRIEQLYELMKHFKDSCVIDASSKPEERERLIKENKITFAINKIAAEGLDVPELSCLHLLAPIGANLTYNSNGNYKFLGNNILQICGRVLRKKDGKKSPKIVIYDDYNIESLTSLCEQLKIFFKKEDIKFLEID